MLLLHKSIPAVTKESNVNQMLGVASYLAAEDMTVFPFSSHGLSWMGYRTNFTLIFFLGYT